MGWGTSICGRQRTTLPVSILILFIAGCVHDGRLGYMEPTLAAKDLAVMQVQCSGLSPVWLDEVDGAKVARPEKADTYQVKVLPGDRYFVFTWGLIDRAAMRVYFVTTPNHTYQVEGLGAQVRITDVATKNSTTFP